MVKIYQYEKCSTCRNALKFLEARGVKYESVRIVDRPPSLAELKRMLGHMGGDVKRLFNTSGLEYRAQNLSKKLPDLSVEAALKLLAANGRLVKRPFLLTEKDGLVGFKPEEWSRLF